MAVGGQRQAPADLSWERDLVPIVQEARWAPGPVWTGAENLAPHRDSISGPSSVASRYIDCAIRPSKLRYILNSISVCSP